MQSVVWTEQFEGPEPPEYSEASDPPAYAIALRPDERRLLVSCGGRLRYIQTGVFTKATKRKDIVLCIFEQNERSKSLPVYGRSSRVEGTLAVSFRADQVASITVKVEGTLKLTMTDWLNETISLVSLSSTLWSHSGRSAPPPIPSEMAYSFRLPSCYLAHHDGANMMLPLPPSFSCDNPVTGVSGFSATVCYSVSVEVEMAKARFNKKNTLTAPFRYLPRSRPPLPTLLPPATFLNTLKIAPEEWMQRSSFIKSRKTGIPPIEVTVVLPKGSIYALSSTLPFHIQLRGQHEVLQMFTSSAANMDINVTLRRKVGVEVKEREGWTTNVIGQGKVSALQDSKMLSNADISVMAWDGEIFSDVEEPVGTFRAGKLYMKDFFVVRLTPDNPITSPFTVHQHFVPIVLTTDHFDEMGDASRI